MVCPNHVSVKILLYCLTSSIYCCVYGLDSNRVAAFSALVFVGFVCQSDGSLVVYVLPMSF